MKHIVRLPLLAAAVALVAAASWPIGAASADDGYGYGYGDGSAAAPDGASFFYGGPHPFPDGMGADYCYINEVHAHPFGPADPALYNWVEGALYFVGDPLAFGASPEILVVYAFVGPHPIDYAFGAGNCYFAGPHHHHWVPNHPELGWYADGGAWRYGGAFDPMYWTYYSFYASYYRTTYRPRVGYARHGGGYSPSGGPGAAVVHGDGRLRSYAHVAGGGPAGVPAPRPFVSKRGPGAHLGSGATMSKGAPRPAVRSGAIKSFHHAGKGR